MPSIMQQLAQVSEWASSANEEEQTSSVSPSMPSFTGQSFSQDWGNFFNPPDFSSYAASTSQQQVSQEVSTTQTSSGDNSTSGNGSGTYTGSYYNEDTSGQDWINPFSSSYDIGMDLSDIFESMPDPLYPPAAPDTDISQVSGVQNIQASQINLGISNTAAGSRKELQGMLQSYLGRSSLIQSAQRQKAIFTVDRFDGGINLNKAPRDLAYWEACQMDCLSPSKIGRLIRLGEFSAAITKTGLMEENGAVIENYGLHYFLFSDSLNTGESFAGGSATNYIAVFEDTAGDVNIWNLDAGSPDEIGNMIEGMNASAKAVFHSSSNRVYVSDASFATGKTFMFGIVDRLKLFPYNSATTVSYNVTSNSVLFKNEDLYLASPVKGIGTGDINVVGTQADSTAIAGISNTSGGVDGTHDGIYININFEDDPIDTTETGWGGPESFGTGAEKYYYIYASFLYDDGSETKLTAVSEKDTGGGGDSQTAHTIKATTTDKYQKMVIKQVLIDGLEFYTNFPRVHGARFYYSEADGADGNLIGNDKYLFAELDFRYGLQLMPDEGNWHVFEDDNGTSDGSTASDLTSIQVQNAANTGADTSPEGTLSISTPPTSWTFFTQNLFYQEELKSDLMWKVSTVGNGVAFIGNIQYDGRTFVDTMLYSGAGEVDSGSAYPMWGTFPVNSNRIDIPGASGGITALKWTSNIILQFRKNAVYIINVEDVLEPKVEGVHQGMGVHGQWAVTETPFGVAWVNDNGAYAYNVSAKAARSLTIGRLDTEDWQSSKEDMDKTKIGYDDRAKMLIITNSTNYDTDGYHYAYSFVTDAWCTWNANKAQAQNVKTNFAIDPDGYLTGAIDSTLDLSLYQWGAVGRTNVDIDYITKDFDFGKPNLDKRFYTLYISYTGGTGQSGMEVYFRVNGKEGSDLANGWFKLETIQDYTDPYYTTSGTAWADSSGTPVTGDPTVNIDTGLLSTSTGEVQKLAKINLRHFGATDTEEVTDTDTNTLPADYLKFARSVQFRIKGQASPTFEINDISLVFKEKRIK